MIICYHIHAKKSDPLVRIQDFVVKISYFTPEIRKTLKNLEASAQV